MKLWLGTSLLIAQIVVLVFSIFLNPALTQSHAVIQSGLVTPNHIVQWVTDGVVSDAGTAANGALTSLGVTASGQNLCANSGVNTGAYNAICLGATMTGGGTLSLTNNAGATGGLNFLVNGALPTGTPSTYACFTAGGNLVSSVAAC